MVSRLAGTLGKGGVHRAPAAVFFPPLVLKILLLSQRSITTLPSAGQYHLRAFRDPKGDYKMKRGTLIGEGGEAKVYKAFFGDGGNKNFAVRVISVPPPNSLFGKTAIKAARSVDGFFGKQEGVLPGGIISQLAQRTLSTFMEAHNKVTHEYFEKIEAEVTMLEAFDSPYISAVSSEVPGVLLSVVEEKGEVSPKQMLEDPSLPREISVVHPLAEGSMNALIEDKNITQVLGFLADATEGLAHVHERGFAHMDIKPENLLLMMNEDGGMIGVLSDFGLAKKVGEEQIGGTPGFRPPDTVVSVK